jgi:mRNA-degrading endonuclease HigB of HigAB toxin-antitoxin module
MEDNLEKYTIQIDSFKSTIINETECVVDILEDIKNCVYIKTLKTEVYIINDSGDSEYSSAIDGKTNNYFNPGEYIYVSLNNFNRIFTTSKEYVPYTWQERVSLNNETYYAHNSDNSGFVDNSTNSDSATNPSNVLFRVRSQDYRILDQTAFNFDKIFIKNIYNNLHKYYDSIYINEKISAPTINTQLTYNNDTNNGNMTHYIVLSNNLSGTSCSPTDTNTLILNPIEPELRKFTIKLWYVNEFGKHELLKFRNTTNNSPLVRLILSFTVYYKRKKLTMV